MQLFSRMVLGAACGVSLVGAQGFQVADPFPWKASKASPLALAKQSDAAMSRLRGNQASILTLLKYEGTGRQNGALVVKDPKTFAGKFAYIHYPTKRKEEPIAGIDFVANGKFVEASGNNFPRIHKTLDAFRFDTSRTVEEWVTGLPRYILGGIRGEAPMTALVSRALKPGSGYKVSVAERVVPFRQDRVPQFQITMERNAAAAKKLGPLRVILEIDARRKLPVQATTWATETGKKLMSVGWMATWNMRSRTFPAAAFKLMSERHSQPVKH